MSFKYKNVAVTLENYRTIFKVCSDDILDEIRSAILDETPIGNYIQLCGEDSYKLGQIRMALRELVPLNYINPRVTGRTLYYIRQIYKDGLDLGMLARYMGTNELYIDANTLEVLSEFVYMGTDISLVDFRKIPKDNVIVICDGLRRHFPMWLITDENVNMTAAYIKALMRGMQLEIDIHPFVVDIWSEEQLYLLFSYSKQININHILEWITRDFDVDRLKVLLELECKNVPILTLCVQDKEGYPIYTSYQMEELGSAIEEGIITHEMYNSNLTDLQIRDLKNKEKEKKQIKKPSKKVKLGGLDDL